MTSNTSEALPTNESRIQTILLVVEDDEDISEFIAQVLQDKTSHAILGVSDAAQAFAAVSSITPSLFILDYQLPDMNGLELSDRLHAIEGLETVPTLMMSANLPPRHALQHRHIVPLKKPFEISDLLKSIDKLLPPQDG
jgi:DNA-binding response OmpR family regulator